MKNGRSYKLITCLLIMVMLLGGCTTFDSFEHTFLEKKSDDTNVINIGVFEPQTGSNSEKGLQEIKGIELANSIYNSVDGYRVNLIKLDTQSSADGAESAIQGILEMNPVAIIGSAGEASSLIASKYIDKAGIPAITPSAINPLITQNTRYYFRASLTNAQMGDGIADYVCAKLNSTHIGIVLPKNDTMASALVDSFNKKKNEVLGKDNEAVVFKREANTENEGSLNKVIKAIMKKNADVVLMPFGAEVMDEFFTLVEKNRLTDVCFIGDRSWGDEAFTEMMKEHPKIKVAFPYLSVMNKESLDTGEMTEEAQRFQIEYEKKYGAKDRPTDSAALGYDSYLLLINAIHRSKSLKGYDIRTALMGLKDVRCATGIFNFDDNGNTVREVNISTIRKGKVVSLHVTEGKAEAEKEEIGGIEK